MCGVLGQISRDTPVDPHLFERMLETLAPRGPDGRGISYFDDGRAALGHTRLSIIDLSGAAAQPMSNEDGTIWLTFNGEIYNFRALRSTLERKGHVFKSQSDSESIIHAYEEWGESCVPMLRGIFAFGIYDTRSRTLLLARDHVGVKPLYYYAGTRAFVFASQPKAILLSEAYGDRAVDRESFSRFLAFGNVPGEHCIYSGIKKLLPGHHLLLREDVMTVSRYWSMRYEPQIKESSKARMDIRERIEECVKAQSVSDVPIGTLLSGGIDSTIITVLLARGGHSDLSTFTMGFEEEESDERQYAALVAEAAGTRHLEGLLTYSEACSLLPDIVEAFDEPFHLNGLLPYFALSRLVQTHHTKVVLGGDGADELFAGYLWYDKLNRAGGHLPTRWLAKLASGIFAASSMKGYLRNYGFLDPAAQERLVGSAMKSTNASAIYDTLSKHWDTNLPPVLAAQVVDFNCFLVDHCLTKVDRTSMACGLEVRVPFLDIELVRLVMSIKHEILFRSGERKALLKEAMADCFPRGMNTRRKKGFSSPLGIWLERGLSRAGEAFLIDGALCSNGYLDPDSLRAHFGELAAGDRLLLISAELWFRRWIENDTQAAKNLADHAVSVGSSAFEVVH